VESSILRYVSAVARRVIDAFVHPQGIKHIIMSTGNTSEGNLALSFPTPRIMSEMEDACPSNLHVGSSIKHFAIDIFYGFPTP
jgi:hypothetical protein